MTSTEFKPSAATCAPACLQAAFEKVSLTAAVAPSQPITPTYKRVDYIVWDDYFMATALLSAKRSKDPNTQVGACIVDKLNRIVAIGYNGMPRNCHDDEFPWSKATDDAADSSLLDDKNLYVVHAEANAILNKSAVDVNDTRLFSTLFPCNECAKLIIQSGISEVIYMSDAKRKKANYRASKRMFDAAGVVYRHFTSTQERIVLEFDTVPTLDS